MATRSTRSLECSSSTGVELVKKILGLWDEDRQQLKKPPASLSTTILEEKTSLDKIISSVTEIVKQITSCAYATELLTSLPLPTTHLKKPWLVALEKFIAHLEVVAFLDTSGDKYDDEKLENQRIFSVVINSAPQVWLYVAVPLKGNHTQRKMLSFYELGKKYDDDKYFLGVKTGQHFKYSTTLNQPDHWEILRNIVGLDILPMNIFISMILNIAGSLLEIEGGVLEKLGFKKLPHSSRKINFEELGSRGLLKANDNQRWVSDQNYNPVCFPKSHIISKGGKRKLDAEDNLAGHWVGIPARVGHPELGITGMETKGEVEGNIILYVDGKLSKLEECRMCDAILHHIREHQLQEFINVVLGRTCPQLKRDASSFLEKIVFTRSGWKLPSYELTMKFIHNEYTSKLLLVHETKKVKTTFYSDHVIFGPPVVRETAIALLPLSGSPGSSGSSALLDDDSAGSGEISQQVYPELLSNKNHDIFLIRELISWITICDNDLQGITNFSETDDFKNFNTIPAVMETRIYQAINFHKLQAELVRAVFLTQENFHEDLIKIILAYAMEVIDLNNMHI